MLPREGRRGIYKKKTVEMEYEYYLEDGHPGDGVFNNRPMRVDTTTLANDPNPDTDMYARLLHVKHENMLECFCIDYTNNNIVYEHFSSLLKDLTMKPLLTYKIPYQKGSVKKHDKYGQIYKGSQEVALPSIKYQYISGSYRSIFREMIEFVCYIHRLNFCLKSLSLENLVLKNEKLKFYGLNLIPKDDEHEIQDFKYLSEVITSLLVHKGCFGGKDRIPADFTNFLECLCEFNHPRNDNENSVETQELFFQNHIAILPYNKRIARIKNYGNRKNTINYSKGRALMAMNVKPGWKKKFQLDLWGPVREVLNFGMYDDQSGRCSDELLWFGRNLGNHLETYFKHYKPTYTPMDLELTIMACLDREVAAFEHDVFKQHVFRSFAQ